MWRPLEDPNELTSLSAEELIQRVEPLLRGGKVPTPPHWLDRVRENIPSLCAELALEWQRAPRLGKRTVPFREYVAAKLRARLHELDQEQNPHVYDDHRRYRPERELLPLRDDARDHPAVTVDLADDCLPEETDVQTTVQQALVNAGIAAASHAPVNGILERFRRGEIGTPYLLKRELGFSPLDARNHPATAAYQALEGLYGPVASTYLK